MVGYLHWSVAETKWGMTVGTWKEVVYYNQITPLPNIPDNSVPHNNPFRSKGFPVFMLILREKPIINYINSSYTYFHFCNFFVLFTEWISYGRIASVSAACQH